MAVTVSGTSITFNDATVQTTAPTAAALVTTTNVLTATASASVGTVGTYAYLCDTTLAAGATRAPGATVAGSSLAYAGSTSVASGSSVVSGTTATGTWRLMGATAGYTFNYGPYDAKTSLWLRIS